MSLRYPFGNISALSNSMVELLTDEALRGQLSSNSVAFASQFGWQKICAKFEAVLRKAIEDHQASRVARLV